MADSVTETVLGTTGDTGKPHSPAEWQSARFARAPMIGQAAGETPLDSEMRCLVPDCPEPHELHLGAPLRQLPSLQVSATTDAGVWSLLNPLWRALREAWSFTREVSGDDAYERYLYHMARAHPGQVPMTRSRYHRFRMEQKWNRISRCC